MATVKITKNGVKNGGQMYAVKVLANGQSFKIHTWCDSIKTANTIKKNVESLINILETLNQNTQRTIIRGFTTNT